MSRQSLPPAEEVEDAPYELRSIRQDMRGPATSTLLCHSRCLVRAALLLSQTESVPRPFTHACGAGSLPSAAAAALRRAPRMVGWALQGAVWLLESPLGPLLMAKGLRDSGVPQAMREVHVPEQATFQPIWPLPAAEDRDAVVVQGQHVQERLSRAARAIPGTLLLPVSPFIRTPACMHKSDRQTKHTQHAAANSHPACTHRV